METKMNNEITAGTIGRKDFMKQVGLGVGAIMLMNCLQSCADTEIPDPNPGGGTGTTGLDFTLKLNDMANQNLNSKGGFVVDKTNKVIVARTQDDTFLAVQSNCTHAGTELQYRSSQRDFYCNNHDSEFSETGAVQVGPATAALKKYNTSYDATANTLRIFA